VVCPVYRVEGWMSVPTRAEGDALVLSPSGTLTAGGSAEEFESSIQAIFKSGYRHLIADLREVTLVDSAGIRALVRGLTSSQRLEGSFKLVAPTPAVVEVLRVSQLDNVFVIHDRLDAALTKRRRSRGSLSIAAGALAVAVVAAAGAYLLPVISEPVQQVIRDDAAGAAAQPASWQPFVELLKLVLATAIGVIVTAVHRRYRRERPQTQAMEQAQVLLCVSGALMMIIIGGSVARAFGIAGAASIIRFRTPVEDPKDITILFLLMGLGMAAGVGLFGVAGLGTLFLCLCLALLNRIGAKRPRAMMAEVEADGREFPTAHVQSVFARNHVIFEPREVSQGKALSVRYYTLLDPDQSLESLSEQLMAGGKANVQSVSWELPRKSE
jgi:anti-anti-sigma factor